METAFRPEFFIAFRQELRDSEGPNFEEATMFSFWKVALIGSVLLVALAPNAFADLSDSCGCNAGLSPQVTNQSSNVALTMSFLEQIDSAQYEKLKKEGSASGDYLGIISGSANYTEFQEKRASLKSSMSFGLSSSQSQSYLFSKVETKDWLDCKKACIASKRSGFTCDLVNYVEKTVAVGCRWAVEGPAADSRKVTVVADAKPVSPLTIPPNVTRDWQFMRNPRKPMLLTFTLDGGSSQSLLIEATPLIENVRVQLSGSTKTARTAGSYPQSEAIVSASEGVLTGGGCEVSYAGNGSAHALVMVKNQPSANGWVCKGADPPGLPATGSATASASYVKLVSSRPSVQLSCVSGEQSSPTGLNPGVEARMTGTQLASGHVLVSGGCASAHAGFGAAHAGPIVESVPNGDLSGWTCKVADPPNVANPTSVTAYWRACRIEDSNPSALAVLPRLTNKRVDGATVRGIYPQATSNLTNGWILTGGGCKVGYAGNGSPHAEFVVRNAPQGGGWACLGADPPNIQNSSFASPVAIGVRAVP